MEPIHSSSRRWLYLLRGGARLDGLDDENTARNYHLLLSAFLIWMGIDGCLAVPFAARKVAATALLAVVVVSAGVALTLLRRGMKRASALVFLTSLWCILAGYSLLRGGVHSNAGGSVACVVILAAWLLGRGPTVAFFCASVLLNLAEAVLEYTGHPLPDYFPGAPLILWASQTGLLILAVSPVIFSLEDLRRQVFTLRRTEERRRVLAQALQSAEECVGITDTDGHFLYVNDAYLRTYGYREEELIGQPLTKIRSDRNPPEVMAAIVPATKAGGWHGEIWNRTKDGRDLFVRLSTSAVHDEDGRVIALVGFTHDITDRLRAEEEKAKVQAQLHQAQKMESVGRLAGGVAHDFNNLLTVINGYSKLILGRLSPGDPVGLRVTEILKAGERAAVLTRQLLAFSRKQTLQPRLLDLNRVVEEIRPMLQRMLGEDIEVKVSATARNGIVMADTHQLEQVIMNLAVNSRDAMPRGGRLSIETSEFHRAEDSGDGSLRSGRYVVLAVTDSGMGMDAATRERIFEPFFTTKDVGKGTGLGLSMVQGIVAQSGGSIVVDSLPGIGTTFRIYLPAADGKVKPMESMAAAPAPAGHETVLVVEDQHDVRDYVVTVLREYGYDVIEAPGGEEALALCESKREPIHLLLSDLIMPRLGGRELAERLSRTRPEIRVLFMSGYPGDTRTERQEDLAAADLIRKPFTSEELARKVRASLSRTVNHLR